MITTYSWNIINEEVNPTYEGYNDYIFRIDWEYIGTKGTYISNIFGFTEFIFPREPYITYVDVTLGDRILWLEEFANGPSLRDQININILHQEYNIIYKWNILSMDLYPNYEGVENYVMNVRWKYDARIDQYNTVYLFGNTSYNSIPTDYIPYNQLTEAIVTDWLDNHSETSLYKINLDRQLYEKLNPQVISLPIPWN
jgi:hypothetical protein